MTYSLVNLNELVENFVTYSYAITSSVKFSNSVGLQEDHWLRYKNKITNVEPMEIGKKTLKIANK